MLSHFSIPVFSPTGRRILRGVLAFGFAALAEVVGCAAEAQSYTPADSTFAPITDLPQSMRDATAIVDELDTQAAKSSDIRTRALLAWRNPLPAFPEGTAELAALTKLGPTDDPVALMLFATGCDAEAVGCDALPLATRWTEFDSDNGAAWLQLWTVDSRLGDTTGSDAALAKAVSARAWRDYTVELSSSFIRVGEGSQDLLVHLVVRLQAAPRVVGIVNALYRSALSVCRFASKHEQCLALTDLISEQPVSLLQATVAASLSAHFGVAPAIAQARRDRIEAWQWAVAQGQPSGMHSNDPRANAQEVITYIDGLDLRGEGAAAIGVLGSHHLSDKEAAGLYQAGRDSANRVGGNLQEQSGAGLHMPRP